MDKNNMSNGQNPSWTTQQMNQIPQYNAPWQSNNQNMNQYPLNQQYGMYQSTSGRINQGPVVGLQALCSACTRLYPDQPNPLQVTARVKYWLGGPDPLDYVSMYWNTGSADKGLPPHWHYVSFGLSDLHGDGRVHPPPQMGPLQPDQISGLGLELSFRLIGEPGHPPTWPAALLQRLATYIFSTGNRFCVGDHVSWHKALDGTDEQLTNVIDDKRKTQRKSKIRHMLVAQDPQLGTVDTPLGTVQFVQVIGITDRELKSAQRSGGSAVLDALLSDSRCGPWFVTDINRRQSISLPEMTHTPSDLSGVAAICRWEYWDPSSEPPQQNEERRASSEIPQNVKEQIKCILQKGLSEINLQSSKDKSDSLKSAKSNLASECKMSTDSAKFALIDDCLKNESSLFSRQQRELAMSTDSFEMSKMSAALLDLKQDPGNNGDDLKVEQNEAPFDFFSNVEPKVDCECGKTDQQNCCKCADDNVWTNGAIAFKGVHLIFDHEAGSFLPVALRCRVLHGRHFTWKAVSEVQAITLVAANVSGAIVTPEKPIAANNGWLQVLIPDDFAEEMANDLQILLENDMNDSEDEEAPQVANYSQVPTVFVWPQRGLKISVFRNVK